jgi:hypothetical protein
MDLTQDVTLRLTEAECRDYVIQLGELTGIAGHAHGGLNTETGLTVLRGLRDLFERHGLGIRPAPAGWRAQWPPLPGMPEDQEV